MANRRTTIELTDFTEPIVSKLETAGFDVRSIVNGSIVAFEKLNGDDQKNCISEANQIKEPINEITTFPPKTLRAAIKSIVEKTKLKQDIPAMMIKVEPSDQKVWDELKKIADIDPDKNKKEIKKIV